MENIIVSDSPALKAYAFYRGAARSHERAGRIDAAWACLEAAHIIGQRATRLHAATHSAMLGLAWRTHRVPEFLGQVLRLGTAALLTWLWVPKGNSGRAHVSALRGSAVPLDLQEFVSLAEGKGHCPGDS